MGDGLLDLAAKQNGLVTRAQARASGLSGDQIRRRVVGGHWQRVHPCVYRLRGSPQTWVAQLQAAALWAGASGAVSHGAAAALWGFSRLEGAPPELTLADHRKPPARIRVHWSNSVPSTDVVVLRGLRVTSRLRTLLDVAGTSDANDARACVDEAMRRRWVTAEQLSRLVERSSNARGVELIRLLVEEYEGGNGPTESELEALVYEVLDAEGLPRPLKQRSVLASGRVRRLDFTFTGTPVVLEADGFAWHANLEVFERERTRHNALTLRGFVVIRWTWRALRDEADRLVAQLRALLSIYGC
jgi:very-short-patch-repair endonuclease